MGNTTITAGSDQYAKILENYASIVEKTNNQLGLGISLSTLAVTILAALIAVIAIFVGWYIWKNSKEQKDLFKATLLEFKNGLEEQANIFLAQKKLEVDKTIAEFEKLKNSVTKEKKAELQKVIDELKKEKENIGLRVQPSSVNLPRSFLSSGAYNVLGTALHTGPTGPIGADYASRSFASLDRIFCSTCGAPNNNSLSIGYCSVCGGKL